MNYIHKKTWSSLQEKYGYGSEDFYGEIIRIRSIGVEGMTYQNVLKIKVSEKGMYMKFRLPLNPFSKPVLIPWSEIKDIQDKNVMFAKFKRLVIGDPFVATLDIPVKDFIKISKYIRLNKAEMV
jgi:hypothetical protein